jgi:minor histocompatibility antigen H13
VQDATGDSESDDLPSRLRRSRHGRPDREVFSFTIEAPSGSKKSKANKKHARSSTVDEAKSVARDRTPSKSTAIEASVEPAGKRQRVR